MMRRVHDCAAGGNGRADTRPLPVNGTSFTNEGEKMQRLATPVRWILVAFLVIPGLAGAGRFAVAAQSGDIDPASYESELSGFEIEISGDDFEIYEADVQDYSHGQGEIVEIASNTAYLQV